jgi:hypothetical protein
MPKLGRSQTVGYAKDSSRNTITTTATKFVKFKDFEVNTKNEYFEDESAFGKREGLLGKEIAKQWAEGKLEAFLDTDGLLGELLLHTFGSVTTAQPGALGAYTHTFNTFLNQTDLSTFTLQYTKGEIGNKRLKGGAIKTLELDFSDKECTVKADIVGLAEETGDAQTVVITKPTRYLLSKLLTSKYATTIAGLGSGTEVKITKLNIKIETGLESDFAFGSLNPIDNLAGTAKVEFSFAGLVRNTTWDLANLNNTKYAYEFDCNMTNLAVLGTSTLYPRLRVRIPPSAVEVTTKIEKDGFVAFEAKGNSEYSVTDTYLIEVLLQNTTTSY